MPGVTHGASASASASAKGDPNWWVEDVYSANRAKVHIKRHRRNNSCLLAIVLLLVVVNATLIFCLIKEKHAGLYGIIDSWCCAGPRHPTAGYTHKEAGDTGKRSEDGHHGNGYGGHGTQLTKGGMPTDPAA